MASMLRGGIAEIAANPVGEPWVPAVAKRQQCRWHERVCPLKQSNSNAFRFQSPRDTFRTKGGMFSAELL